MSDKDSKGGDGPPSYQKPEVILISGEQGDEQSSCEPTGAADVIAGDGHSPEGGKVHVWCGGGTRPYNKRGE